MQVTGGTATHDIQSRHHISLREMMKTPDTAADDSLLYNTQKDIKG